MLTEPHQDIANATFSHLLGGRVKVMQPTKGYRVGMDGAVLAAACAGLAPKGKALELGCGVGGALLSLKARRPDLVLTGIEREGDYARLARGNVILNGFDGVSVIDGDIGAGFKALSPPLLAGEGDREAVEGAGRKALERFDLVFSNPPYFDDPGLLRAPHDAKRPAWIADDGLKAWLDFALAAAKDGGDIVFIHRADRLGDLLGGLGAKAGSFIVRPIQPFADKDAKRVLVRAQRMGKAPLRLLPPLVLHDHGERQHTDEVEAILRGEALLGW